jgi:hypothetical protein
MNPSRASAFQLSSEPLRRVNRRSARSASDIRPVYPHHGRVTAGSEERWCCESTRPLVGSRATLADLGVPLVCAGGIGDEQAFVEALDIGYAAEQLGIRFTATTECRPHDDYKQAIVRARAPATSC